MRRLRDYLGICLLGWTTTAGLMSSNVCRAEDLDIEPLVTAPAAVEATPASQVTAVPEPMPQPVVQQYYQPVTYEQPKLFGLIAPSDHNFSGFISPMTNPVYFEDPRTLTEARFIIANHQIPTALGGSNVQYFAMQARAALTENLSIIATKDGFFISENPLVKDGFADVNAGLKYNLFKNVETQSIVSSGFTYGIPLGSHRSLQGRGTGEFNFFLSGGQQIGENYHVLSTFGARLPGNNAKYSSSTYWSNHLDRKIGNRGFYLFTEANWFHWMSGGTQFPANVEGQDLFNLGSAGVGGNSLVTGAYGVKYKPHQQLEIGVAYEIPYTSRRDIIRDRVTFDLIVRY